MRLPVLLQKHARRAIRMPLSVVVVVVVVVAVWWWWWIHDVVNKRNLIAN